MEHTPVAPLWPGQRPATKPCAPFALGEPLTTNPPHPLVKAADDELILRGMAYGTRKSYGQHLPCATHLLEDGVAMRYIQELLGHGILHMHQRN